MNWGFFAYAERQVLQLCSENTIEIINITVFHYPKILYMSYVSATNCSHYQWECLKQCIQLSIGWYVQGGLARGGGSGMASMARATPTYI